MPNEKILLSQGYPSFEANTGEESSSVRSSAVLTSSLAPRLLGRHPNCQPLGSRLMSHTEQLRLSL